jgi:hypothetical protein
MGWKVTNIVTLNSGTGYSLEGIVQVVGGAGVPCLLGYTASGGSVRSSYIDNPGSYTTLPPSPASTYGAGNNDWTVVLAFQPIVIATGFAAPTDMMSYFDRRTIGELLDDNGQPVIDIVNSAILQEFLLAASGQIAAACQVSGIYTPLDLTTVAQSTDPSAALLRRLTCTLAAVMLVQRRFDKLSSDYWKEREKWCEDYLDRLRKGQRLFIAALSDVVDAGNPTVNGPTALDYRMLNLLPDRTQNYYPNRAQRLPLGRGF